MFFYGFSVGKRVQIYLKNVHIGSELFETEVVSSLSPTKTGRRFLRHFFFLTFNPSVSENLVSINFIDRFGFVHFLVSIPAFFY